MLKLSTLKSLAVGSSTKNKTTYEEQIQMWTERALIKIYTDLNLSAGIIRVYKNEEESLYDMPEDYMQIITATRPDGELCPVNKSDRLDSIYTPEQKKVMLPSMYDDTWVDIIYQKVPVSVTLKGEEDFPLQPQYIEAIILYVSYIAYELIHGVPNWEHQSYLTKYEKAINDLKANGLTGNSGIVNQKIHYKGFV